MRKKRERMGAQRYSAPTKTLCYDSVNNLKISYLHVYFLIKSSSFLHKRGRTARMNRLK